MAFETAHYDRYSIITMTTNNLNSLVSPEFKSHLVMLRQEKDVKNVIVDMTDVEFVDSSGLSAILTGNRLWLGNNHSFILANIQHPSVKTLIDISRLDDVLTIIPTLQESIDFVIMEELQRELFEEEE